MSQKWDEWIKEDVSSELEHKTMTRARQELRSSSESTHFFKVFIPSFGGLTLLAIFFKYKDFFGSSTESQWVQAEQEAVLSELAEWTEEELNELDEELLAELEFFEDFELLEEWDGKEDV